MRIISQKRYYKYRGRQASISEHLQKGITKFATINNVLPNSNCGIYAIIEGLLNITVDVTMDVNEFRKLTYDCIDEHRDELNTNLAYSRSTRSSITKIKEKHDEIIEQ